MGTVETLRSPDGVVELRLNRPERLNTFTRELVDELSRALAEVDADADARVLIITGNGRAFSAGLDLNGYGDEDDADYTGSTIQLFARQRAIAALAESIHTLRIPVIAAVNGPAAGAGIAIACASDVRIGSTKAIFAVSFIRAGYSACDIGTSWLLPRIVGTGHAHDLMLTGRRCDAEEALRIGLITQVVAPEDLLDTARAKATEILLNPPFSVELTKAGMWAALETPSFHASVEFENRQQILTALTADALEARAAFLDKRPPAYKYQ